MDAEHADNKVSSKFKDGIFFELDNFVIPDLKGDGHKIERLTEETTTLRLEEIVAMVLSHAKHISDKFGKANF